MILSVLKEYGRPVKAFNIACEIGLSSIEVSGRIRSNLAPYVKIIRPTYPNTFCLYELTNAGVMLKW